MNELNNIPYRLCKRCEKCGCNPDGTPKYPASVWDKMPDGCGFEGWIFIEQEKIKQKVRKQKELLLSLEIKLKTTSEIEKNKISEQIKKIETEIQLYKKQGSEFW